MGKKRFWSSPHLYYKPLSLKAPFDKTVVKITPFYVDYLTLSSFKTGQTNLQKKIVLSLRQQTQPICLVLFCSFSSKHMIKRKSLKKIYKLLPPGSYIFFFFALILPHNPLS